MYKKFVAKKKKKKKKPKPKQDSELRSRTRGVVLTTVEINLATICFFELKRERQKMGFVSLEGNVKGGEERGEEGIRV